MNRSSQSDMCGEEIRAWLRLARLEIAPRKAYALLAHFPSPQAIFEAGESELAAVPGVNSATVQKVLCSAKSAEETEVIERDVKTLESLGASIVPITADGYPHNLKQIFDPPPVLFVRGEFVESDRFAVAIVGSRRPSPYGAAMAEKVARDLAARRLTVVSGGARGIDSAAHKGALAASGRTIAVMGCGIDQVYPPENAQLFDKIAETGAVISEFPLGAGPDAWRFPARNRLISGLSLGVLVAEGAEDSGALITAQYAADQGREVFAVPGNVDNVRSRGPHRLIKDGAKLVESAEDVLEELGVAVEPQAKEQLAMALDDLSPDHRKLIELLSLQPKHVDQIIDESGLQASQVIGSLTILEMKGVIRRVPGNAYVRAL